MSKRKSSFLVEEVLPDDDKLGYRSNVWRNMMEKYSKIVSKEELDISNIINALDYDQSDESRVSDVESVGNVDSDQENREELSKQLTSVVEKRKQVWQQTGLEKMMSSIEDQTNRFNLLSHEKVENWLNNRSNGAALEMTQGHETLMTEKNEEGDRMRFHRKQQLTVSAKDDADSLYSVDTAKYILSNKAKQKGYSKIKVTTMIKSYTITNNANNSGQQRLHSISSFPAIEEEHPTVRPLCKSDSNFPAAEVKNVPKHVTFRAPELTKNVTESVARAAKDNKRKKVFKKTMKKKPANSKAANTRCATASEQLEEALKNACTVKKIPLTKSKKKNIHWKETSLRKSASSSNNSDSSSSSDDEANEVFLRSKAKPVVPPKRELRRRVPRVSSGSEYSEHSPRKPAKKMSPRKKFVESPNKVIDKDLVTPFQAICLSPRKNKNKAREKLNCTTQNDQTTNLTTLFSAANDKITNSTKINDVTSSSSSSFLDSTNRGRNRSIFPDQARCLVIYEPKTIRPGLSNEERIRITMSDLNLKNVTKKRHLDKFTKFSCVIHPNSSVRFFPSDSEEDEPSPVSNAGNEDESFDECDPILTFNPRFTDRLNVMECMYE